jgi:lipopolysaccharide transport system ATP-binding protein
MSDDVLVKVEGVSKKFCRSLKRSLWYGAQDVASEMLGRNGHHDELRKNEFWAVNDVSFELKRGECLGLIGRNGAGKTSLLRILNGLIRPDKGLVSIKGYVGAMIALGAGGKDILTGRENVFAMAALRGMSRKQAESKLDEILEFAEIEDAIDAPLQTYSSGMRVRLNFAVASVLEPDVLLLDEVLAVGDAAFRNKCYSRIAELRRNAAVIFVSHNMEHIARTTTQCLVLDHGKTAFLGSIEEGIQVYEELNLENAQNQITRGAFLSVTPPLSLFHASLSAEEIESGESLGLVLGFNSEAIVKDFAVKIHFYNSRGAFAADGFIASQEIGKPFIKGSNCFQFEIPKLPLKNGMYAVAIAVLDEIGDLLVWSYKNHTIKVTGAYHGGVSDCQLALAVKNNVNNLDCC